MIIVDSSVWIPFFNGKDTPETDILASLLGTQLIGIGDLILTEVLQGFRYDKDYELAKIHLTHLPCYPMVGIEMALKSADHYRSLRRKGITIRKTIDVLIATYCIEHGYFLLHADRDFDQMEAHLGLKRYSKI